MRVFFRYFQRRWRSLRSAVPLMSLSSASAGLLPRVAAGAEVSWAPRLAPSRAQVPRPPASHIERTGLVPFSALRLSALAAHTV